MLKVNLSKAYREWMNLPIFLLFFAGTFPSCHPEMIILVILIHILDKVGNFQFDSVSWSSTLCWTGVVGSLGLGGGC